MTFGPRLCCSTSAATVAPATVGAPSTGESPPTKRTSPSCTIVPTSPAILPISSTSSGTTRYCRPPVLMTANIVVFLRVRSRPRQFPKRVCPGRLFLQSLWVQFPRDPGAIPLSRTKTSGARKIPRRVGGTYSPPGSRVKAKQVQNGPKMRDLAHFRPAGPSLGDRGIRPVKPTGSPAVVLQLWHGQRQNG